MNFKTRMKLMLLGEESLFSYFLGKEIEQITLGVMGLFYMPLLLLVQIYLLVDIYFKVQSNTSTARPVTLSVLLLGLALLYGFFVYRAKRKKDKILQVEKAAKDLPQIFINVVLEALKSERSDFLNNKK